MEIYKSTYRFNASHNMTDDPAGKHPHTFLLTVLMLVESQADYGTYAKIEKELEEHTEHLQGIYVNYLDFFDDKKATVENFALYFYEYVKGLIVSPGVRLLEIELGDSPLNKVSVGDAAMVGSMNMYIPKKKIEKYFEIIGNRKCS